MNLKIMFKDERLYLLFGVSYPYVDLTISVKKKYFKTLIKVLFKFYVME